MRITHFCNDDSKLAQTMRYDVEHVKGDLFEAYNRPSISKVQAFEAIRNEYTYDDTIVLGIPCKTIKVPHKLGKLNDNMYIRYIRESLNVAGASTHFFSTVALFEDVETSETYIIKETYSNTYMCRL